MSQHYDKKAKTWYCSYRFKDCSGREHQTKKRGFKTKHEAKEYEASQLRMYSNDLNMNFREFYKGHYLPSFETRVKRTTYRNRVSILDNHVLPYFGFMAINAIKASDVEQWRVDMLHRGKTPATVRSAMDALNILLNYAVKMYDLQKNPMVKVDKQKVIRPEKEVWSLEEFQQAIKYEYNRLYEVAFYLLFNTGMRIGELLALKPDDVQGSTVYIRHNYDSVEKLTTTPKTSTSKRSITIPLWLANMIAEYKMLYSDKITGRLFPRSRPSFAQHLNEIIKQSGVSKITLHGFRHSHATYLIEKGVSIAEVSKRLGHSNTAITLKTYTHLYNKSDDGIVKLLECSEPKLKDYGTSNLVRMTQRKKKEVPILFPRVLQSSIIGDSLQI